MGFAAMKDGYGAENRCSIAQFRVIDSRLALKKAGNRRIAFKTVPKKRGKFRSALSVWAIRDLGFR